MKGLPSLGVIWVSTALFACDPHVSVSGTLRLADGGVARQQVVELVCPPGTQVSIAKSIKTDPAGNFRLEGVGCLPPQCSLRFGLGTDSPGEGSMSCRSRNRFCPEGTCSEAVLSR
jgi:hypothetical protein